MKYNFNGKTLNIPDKDLEHTIKTLKVSTEEAIEIWLDDNDYTTNEVVEELSKKAKQEIKRYEQSDKKRKSPTRERKVDVEKAFLLRILIDAIEKEHTITATKNEAEFAFSHGENDYTVKLIKHRKKADGG